MIYLRNILGAILILRNAEFGERGVPQLRYFVLRCKRGGGVFIVKIRYVTHEKKFYYFYYILLATSNKIPHLLRFISL